MNENIISEFVRVVAQGPAEPLPENREEDAMLTLIRDHPGTTVEIDEKTAVGYLWDCYGSARMGGSAPGVDIWYLMTDADPWAEPFIVTWQCGLRLFARLLSREEWCDLLEKHG